MQFKVPQDVQREDTIVGPLTLKQLIILGCGGGIAYAIYISLSKTYFLEIWLPPVAIISILTLALAFLKIHDLKFHEYLMALIEYHLLAKKRYWIQGAATPFTSSFDKEDNNKKVKKVLTKKPQQNLQELSNILNNPPK